MVIAGYLAAQNVSFYDRQDTAVAGRNALIAAGDFDCNGSFHKSQTLPVWGNHGDGTFQSPLVYFEGGYYASSRTADLKLPKTRKFTRVPTYFAIISPNSSTSCVTSPDTWIHSIQLNS